MQNHYAGLFAPGIKVSLPGINNMPPTGTQNHRLINTDKDYCHSSFTVLCEACNKISYHFCKKQVRNKLSKFNKCYFRHNTHPARVTNKSITAVNI